MKIFKIYGASDDLIETEGIPGSNEFGVYGDSPYKGKGVITSKKGTLDIHVIYNGYWAFALGSKDGDDCDKFPDWLMERKWGKDEDYSETITIEVPDDAKFKFYPNK